MRGHHIDCAVSRGKEAGKYCGHSLMITGHYARSSYVERQVSRVIRHLLRASVLTTQLGSTSVQRVAQIVTIIEGAALKANAPD